MTNISTQGKMFDKDINWSYLAVRWFVLQATMTIRSRDLSFFYVTFEGKHPVSLEFFIVSNIRNWIFSIWHLNDDFVWKIAMSLLNLNISTFQNSNQHNFHYFQTNFVFVFSCSWIIINLFHSFYFPFFTHATYIRR